MKSDQGRIYTQGGEGNVSKVMRKWACEHNAKTPIQMLPRTRKCTHMSKICSIWVTKARCGAACAGRMQYMAASIEGVTDDDELVGVSLE
jgi:hypothetical protein